MIDVVCVERRIATVTRASRREHPADRVPRIPLSTRTDWPLGDTQHSFAAFGVDDVNLSGFGAADWPASRVTLKTRRRMRRRIRTSASSSAPSRRCSSVGKTTRAATDVAAGGKRRRDPSSFMLTLSSHQWPLGHTVVGRHLHDDVGVFQRSAGLSATTSGFRPPLLL